MKFTIIIWVLVAAMILFAAMTFYTYSLSNSTLWAGMNAPVWETGAIMILLPVSILGFGFALVIAIFKGPKPKFSIGERM